MLLIMGIHALSLTPQKEYEKAALWVHICSYQYYNLRNNQDLATPNPRLETLMRFLFPFCTNLWNNLPIEIQLAVGSLDEFKISLQKSEMIGIFYIIMANNGLQYIMLECKSGAVKWKMTCVTTCM